MPISLVGTDEFEDLSWKVGAAPRQHQQPCHDKGYCTALTQVNLTALPYRTLLG